MASLYNVDLELNYIAGLLKYPDTYQDTDYLTPQDFSKANGDIFGVIKSIIESGDHPTSVIIAEKCHAISVVLDGVDIKDFCDALSIRQIDKQGVSPSARELKKKAIIRKICENADKLKREVVERQTEPAKVIVQITDKYLGESLISLTGDDKKATNLLQVLPGIIEDMGNSPDESPYINTPYETWNNVFGPLRPGQLYFTIARQGSNKSTLLLDMMRKIPEANPKKPNLNILYLDTEMRIEDAVVRYIAGKIGCPYWLIDSRQWRKDAKWSPIIRKELDMIMNSKNKNLWFESIGNMSGKELVKFVRRWKLQQCGRENEAVIIYDYLKINVADKADSNSQSEFEMAYEKTEMLKDVAEKVDAPLLSALQANRAGDGASRAGADDSSAAASISDRIGWLAALMLILRRRMPDEVNKDSFPNMPAPSHMLKDIKQRYLGKDGPDYLGYVKVKIGNEIKYLKNYINMDINNFNVTDKGTYSQWLEAAGKLKVTPSTSKESLNAFSDNSGK